MQFAKGQSGNPGGRPRGHGEIRELARAHTELALQTLVEIATRGVVESARVAAANSLLDRGYGKPPASLELREPDPEHIFELITEAERNLDELFAAPVAITDADRTTTPSSDLGTGGRRRISQR